MNRFCEKHGSADIIIRGLLLSLVPIPNAQTLGFAMKNNSLHDFKTSTPFKQNSSHHFKDFHKLKYLKNFDVNLTQVTNNVLNVQFITLPGDEVRLTSKFVRSFSLRKSLK